VNPIVKAPASLPTHAEGSPANLYSDTDGRLHVRSASEAAISSIGHGVYSVLTSAAALGSGVVRAIALQAPSGNANSVFLGGAGVTTATGYELSAGREIILSDIDLAALFAVASAGGNTLRLLKVLA
jgi:hypothetical protein